MHVSTTAAPGDFHVIQRTGYTLLICSHTGLWRADLQGVKISNLDQTQNLKIWGVHTRATQAYACGAEEKWNGRLLDSVGVGHGSDPFHQPIRRDEGANAVAGRR